MAFVYKRIVLLLGILLISIILLYACRSENIQKEKSIKPEFLIAKTGIISKEPWEVEWDELLAKAKKEGPLVILSTADPSVREAMREGFYKKTGLELETIAGRGSEISARLFAERRASLYTMDVYVGGSQTLLAAVKPGGALESLGPQFFLPEVVDPKAWFFRELQWLDNEKSLVFGFLAFIQGGTNPV